MIHNTSGKSLRRFEKIPVKIYADSEEGSLYVAQQIEQLIREKAEKNEMAVLGLATGSSPTKVYELLVEMHVKEGLSFQNVVTFNLDEYYPIAPDSLQSYVRFMDEYLFNLVDINRAHIHIPDGTLAPEKIKDFCQQYEEKIAAYGGLDIQLLGIGRTGHVGFNEPGSSMDSKTRLIRLDGITQLDAASDFFGIENVPGRAITMGVGSILAAKKIYLLAWGEGKASVIKSSVEERVRESVPATYLQIHPDCEFILDEASANELTRVKTPWLVEDCDWDEKLIKKAVIWLSKKLEKVILKLTNEDYNEHGMGNLVAEYGTAEEINLTVFNQLQQTITGWPGGKPNVDDSRRPERAAPFPKRSIIFSPHPDDDVISMGGTLMRLVDQGHDVHVAYQTSGNIAVFDDEVIRFLDFTRSVVKNEQANKELEQMIQETRHFVENKKPGQIDTPEIQRIKGLIRQGEALSSCRYCGVQEKNAHFLNLPFYETGKVKKNPIGAADVEIICELLQKLKPDQIFAAGDLSDPHGTHRVCLQAIFQAIEKLKQTEEWIQNTYLWLYRGAWQEWEISDIEMAIPIGPKDLARKRNAIYKHQSQKDSAMFPGHDSREFWQRAEDRNRQTAKEYDDLGLPEYEAIEAFVRHIF